MQRARSASPRGHRARIALFAIALSLRWSRRSRRRRRIRPAPWSGSGRPASSRSAIGADARPFSYRDESGNAAGYSVALCQKIAEQVKAELRLSTLAVEWVPVTLEDRFRAVQEGKIDLLCGAESATLSRRKEVSLLDLRSSRAGSGRFCVRIRSSRAAGRPGRESQPSGPLWRGSPGADPGGQDLLGRHWYDERELAGGSASTSSSSPPRSFPSRATTPACERVLDRSADVFFGERAILLEPPVRSPSARDLIVLDRQFTYEPIALAFARGDEDFRLVVDRALSRLFGSGEFRDLYAKWFGEPDENARTFFRWTALPE